MSERPVLLKLLLREHHWQNYATFCAEYDKAAARIDPDLMRSFPSRAQLHRWLTGSLRGLPYPDHCRVLEEMFPGWTAEQLFQPAVPELLYASGRSSGLLRRDPGTTGPPVFAAPSVGLRPFIKQAFTREHVTIDFAGFSAKPSTAQSRNPSTRSHRPEQARHPGDTAAAADTSRPMV